MKTESIIWILGNAIKDIESHKQLDPLCKSSGNLKNAIDTINVCIGYLSGEPKTAEEKTAPKMLRVLEKIERELSIDTTPYYVCVGTMVELRDVIREARGLPKPI